MQYEIELGSQGNSLVVNEVSPEEVRRYIAELRNNISSDCDDVKVALVKAVASILSPILA